MGVRRVPFAALALLLAAPVTASAASPLLVREVFPGVSGKTGAEYVELQMVSDGHHDVDGQVLRFYGASGVESSSFPLGNDVAEGEAQRTVLVATDAMAMFGTATPDFVLPPGNRLDPAGGAVCFTGVPGAEDCVTWGSMPALQSGDGFPDPQSANAPAVPDGKSLTRKIGAGCGTALDPADDTDDSHTDFIATALSPRANSTAPTEVRCIPNTIVQTFPPNPSRFTSVAFSYLEFPPEDVVWFECSLDWEDPLDDGDFSPCPNKSVLYPGPLADGPHRFSVRAVVPGGMDPTPDVYSWTVDTVSPQTILDSIPPDPTWGFRLAYAYRSSETESGFECQLDGGPVEVCGAAGKSYFLLSDGPHAFRVWATDNAGNKDPTPAEAIVTVDNRIGDRTPPNTEIASRPSDPTADSAASFLYTSSEPGSSFECRLAPAPFEPCPASGIRYRGLRNREYSFEVRAIDRAGNVDSVPARYAWRVAAPAPRARFTRAPGGQVPRGRKAVFAFSSSAPRSRFLCRLDLKGVYRPCRSPHRVSAGPGRHVLAVLAVDRLGNRSDSPALRIFRVRSPDSRSWFAQAGRLLSSFEVEIVPSALPARRFAPVALRFASSFENLDGSDTPTLRGMVLRLAAGGVVDSTGLPRCATPDLRFRTAAEALGACRRALVGRGTVTTALRFPEGSRIPSKATLLLFNAGRDEVLMHISAERPVATTFVVPIQLDSGPQGTVLRARFPAIAGGNGFLTGFRMTLERTYRFRGRTRSYLRARCPVPANSGLRQLAFELGRIAYRFEGGRTLVNSSLNTCSVRGGG